MKSKKAALQAAAELYESFREKTPRRIGDIKFDLPKAVAIIGHVDQIGYRTTHGKKVVYYKHEFSKGSRPLFCVSADGRQLLLLGGRFKFTDRGIVDRDAKGSEIDNPQHGDPI